MPESELLTVKEFAARAGLSTQRIYQLLAKDLQSYCKVVNGSKYVDSAALDILLNQTILQATCKAVAKDLQSKTGTDTGTESELQRQLDTLRAQLDTVTEQLHKEQIRAAAAESALQAEQRRADDQSAALHAAMDALSAAQQNAAALTAALQDAQRLHAAQIAMQPPADQSADKGETKRGLWARLFKRK